MSDNIINIKINLPGGIVSAGDLYEILLVAEHSGAEAIRFGNRQQLYFSIESDRLEDLEHELFKLEIPFEADTHEFPNIVSSYVTDSIFAAESWMREGVYRDIFDQFDFKPQLKINLVDGRQTFVPFFSGNLNFISSPVSNYWYWYTRFPKTGSVYCWPDLVYSADIPMICKSTEAIILNEPERFYDQPDVSHAAFREVVLRSTAFASHPIRDSLKLPEFYLPYYEGMNAYGNKRYWLGIYRRNELFPISLLKDICTLCFNIRIGQLYTTPWKSLVVKGIVEEDRIAWSALLNKHRLNVRHAYNELNWQLENLCAEGLQLKHHLVRELEAQDIRTYKLCFAIKMHPKSGLMGSIIIKKGAHGYDVLHTRDFNPNSRDFIVFEQAVEEDELAGLLIQLCNDYYKHVGTDERFLSPAGVIKQADTAPDNIHTVYQCVCCLSIYDERYGDESNGINPGTPFLKVVDYRCPVCDADHLSFKPVVKVLTSMQ